MAIHETESERDLKDELTKSVAALPFRDCMSKEICRRRASQGGLDYGIAQVFPFLSCLVFLFLPQIGDQITYVIVSLRIS
ncbi:hypothetical protein TorRG33x02_018230 [Trema orientale]|uniref:Uncharacterized protein n=1 Tax=Trema orientale TaxID=63057 RepID=A0A2P5FYJ8_TREOI|nr:hypothetical protein TorRG33x02_018230 [Trema orientale]